MIQPTLIELDKYDDGMQRMYDALSFANNNRELFDKETGDKLIMILNMAYARLRFSKGSNGMHLITDEEGDEIMEMFDYHKLQVNVHLDAIYQQGVQDGRRQMSETKAEIARRYDSKIAELERTIARLQLRLREVQSEQGPGGQTDG